MKLELKQIIGYLPYGLKAEITYLNERDGTFTHKEGVWINTLLSFFDEGMIYSTKNQSNTSIKSKVIGIKPILITELSKENLEYVFATKIKDREDESTLRMWLDNIHAVFMKFDNCQLIFDRLYELQYDLHNLVQQGLAIKK
jgi:hypothetical protein